MKDDVDDADEKICETKGLGVRREEERSCVRPCAKKKYVIAIGVGLDMVVFSFRYLEGSDSKSRSGSKSCLSLPIHSIKTNQSELAASMNVIIKHISKITNVRVRYQQGRKKLQIKRN